MFANASVDPLFMPMSDDAALLRDDAFSSAPGSFSSLPAYAPYDPISSGKP
jgi:hypothetical protein